MEKLGFLFLVFGWPLLLQAQHKHLDYLGGGHDNQVVVTTSSSVSNESTGHRTVDGFPIQNPAQLKAASRFLAQATMGADYATIQMTAAMGYEAWLDEQFQLPQVSIMDEMLIHNILYGDEGETIEEPIFHQFFRSAWMTNQLSSPDLLRQRMAFNLSQIMVINDKSDFFEDVGQIIGTYYDMLQTNAFANYQTLLTDVTLSPAMGFFLSHFNNPKENLEENIHPDENYAREIMQLFSIGLWELNPNGLRRRDEQGQFIPTYNNAHIKEFAQVFTGLGAGPANGVFGEITNELLEDVTPIVMTPMKMYPDFHDTSEKHLLNGVVLPANQSGMDDINQTIAHLSNHPNTAPFISKSLIKLFTTSNPSATYVQDVGGAFDPDSPNNFQAVLKAILLHPEARSCSPTPGYTFGKLREPVVRLMNYLKAFHLSSNTNEDYFTLLECFADKTGQSPLESPSVFNFYLPDYSPPGPINQNYLTAPSFQILNSTNAIGIVNDVDLRTIRGGYFASECIGDEEFGEEEQEEGDEEDDEEQDEADEEEDYYEDDPSFYQIDFSEVLPLAADPTELINYLDILIANGLLQEDTKQIINGAISQLDNPEQRLKMALYLILIAPDYAILK
ncbi:MAG: DUF1800 domain-containing protein [Saprospiraceae bacterium]|nr:DUF1800 domain-containing protein [Saprospiraceae bacterium]